MCYLNSQSEKCCQVANKTKTQPRRKYKSEHNQRENVYDCWNFKKVCIPFSAGLGHKPSRPVSGAQKNDPILRAPVPNWKAQISICNGWYVIYWLIFWTLLSSFRTPNGLRLKFESLFPSKALHSKLSECYQLRGFVQTSIRPIASGRWDWFSN